MELPPPPPQPCCLFASANAGASGAAGQTRGGGGGGVGGGAGTGVGAVPVEGRPRSVGGRVQQVQVPPPHLGQHAHEPHQPLLPQHVLSRQRITTAITTCGDGRRALWRRCVSAAHLYWSAWHPHRCNCAGGVCRNRGWRRGSAFRHLGLFRSLQEMPSTAFHAAAVTPRTQHGMGSCGSIARSSSAACVPPDEQSDRDLPYVRNHKQSARASATPSRSARLQVDEVEMDACMLRLR